MSIYNNIVTIQLLLSINLIVFSLFCCYSFRLPQPPKMRITEEKVSASLRDMHISNEFKTHNYCDNSYVNNMDVSNVLKLLRIQFSSLFLL